jgi:5'-3' exonuclease
MSKERYLSILNDIKNQGGSEQGQNPNDNILIIDGLNTFIRVFSVIPTTNDNGTHIGGIVGFLKSIGYTINMFRPTRCIIIWDGKGGSSRRRKMYPEYKAKRKTNIRLNRAYDFETIEEERANMIRQIQRTIKYLNFLPITMLSIDNVEADDIIAYASKQVLTDSKVTIMSSDKDFLQLVDDRISVWSPTKKKLYKPENVLEEYGIPSHNLLMYRIFDGDKSDNINGVFGYGLKTVQKKLPFLQEEKTFSVDEAIKESGELEQHRELMERNFDLMQLHNVDISASAKTKTIDKIREPIPNLDKVVFKKMFLEDKMYSALPNLESWLQTKFQTLVKFIGQ